MLLKTQNSKVKVIIFFTLLILVLSFAHFGCDNRSTKVITVIMVNRIELAEEVTITIGHQRPLIITIIPENATNKEVEWESSDKEIVDVTEDGILTALSVGEAIITVTSKDRGANNTCHVIVTEDVIPVSGVILNQTSINLNIGDTETLIATINPENATNQEVIWASENEDIAIVSPEGDIIAISGGITTISVTTLDRNHSAECMVRVVYVFEVYNREQLISAFEFIRDNGDNHHYYINILSDMYGTVFTYLFWGTATGIKILINGNNHTCFFNIKVRSHQHVTIIDLNFSNINVGVSMEHTVQGDGAILIMQGNSSIKYKPYTSGVSVLDGGTFIMKDGMISNNIRYAPGGGVYVYRGTFIMEGGVIRENLATSDYPVGYSYPGGGVYVSGGDFFMYGGSIEANYSPWVGGVYIGGVSWWPEPPAEPGTFIMYGGIIYGRVSTGVPEELANNGQYGHTALGKTGQSIAKYGDGTDIFPDSEGIYAATDETIIGRR